MEVTKSSISSSPAAANIASVFRDARRNPRDFITRLWCPRTLAKSLIILTGLVLFGLVLFEILLYSGTGRSSRLGSIVSTPIILLTRPSVTLPQGTYRGGTAQPGLQFLDVYKGIPYAQTTGGNNRFRPPVKLVVSDATRDVVHDARNFGPRCWSAGVTAGDDCLNLNIWRPRSLWAGQKVPVAVYIHGGSFNFGSGAERDMGSFVSWSAEPIIGVTLNYRLGALGFLNSNLTAKEGILNLGLRDQAAAFEWLQENIEHFGGDKNAVTIWGASAGAHSVGHHLMKVDKPAPFHRVIMESGAPTSRAVYPYNHPLHEKQYQEFLNLTGTADIPDASKLAHLRALDIKTIVSASETIFNRYNPSLRWPFQPVIDGPGGMIPTAPIASWNAGAYHKVPILTGFNTNEGNGFVSKAAATSKQFNDFFATLLPALNATGLASLDALYPDPATHADSPYVDTRRGVGAQFKRLAAAYGDYAYIAPVRHTAHFAGAAGAGADVWLYQLAANKTVVDGAAHGIQGEYVINAASVRELKWPAQGQMAAQMHAYWASFVATGDVNAVRGEGRGEWAPYAAGQGDGAAKMVFGAGNDERAGGGAEGVLAESRPDSWGWREGEWWWARVGLSESG